MTENKDRKSLDQEKKYLSEKKGQLEVEEHEHVETEEKLDPELEALIQTDFKKGLSNTEAESRLVKFGRNGICLSLYFFPISLLII